MSTSDSPDIDPADRRIFVLPPAEFDAFEAILDAEPVESPKLRLLLSTPTRLEQPEPDIADALRTNLPEFFGPSR